MGLRASARTTVSGTVPVGRCVGSAADQRGRSANTGRSNRSLTDNACEFCPGLPEARTGLGRSQVSFFRFSSEVDQARTPIGTPHRFRMDSTGVRRSPRFLPGPVRVSRGAVDSTGAAVSAEEEAPLCQATWHRGSCRDGRDIWIA